MPDADLFYLSQILGTMSIFGSVIEYEPYFRFAYHCPCICRPVTSTKKFLLALRQWLCMAVWCILFPRIYQFILIDNIAAQYLLYRWFSIHAQSRYTAHGQYIKVSPSSASSDRYWQQYRHLQIPCRFVSRRQWPYHDLSAWNSGVRCHFKAAFRTLYNHLAIDRISLYSMVNSMHLRL